MKSNVNKSACESRARVRTNLDYERIFVRLGFRTVIGLRIVRDLGQGRRQFCLTQVDGRLYGEEHSES